MGKAGVVFDGPQFFAGGVEQDEAMVAVDLFPEGRQGDETAVGEAGAGVRAKVVRLGDAADFVRREVREIPADDEVGRRVANDEAPVADRRGAGDVGLIGRRVFRQAEFGEDFALLRQI